MDRSDDAVEYARGHYAHPKVRFEAADAMTYSDDVGFATVVSLETIEHVSEPARLIEKLVGLLRPHGRFVASVPTTPSTDVNPHHLPDFTEKSFRAMVVRHGLEEVACLRQVQPYRLCAALQRTEARMQDLRLRLLRYYLGHPRAAAARLGSTLRFGLTNRYITVVWQRRG